MRTTLLLTIITLSSLHGMEKDWNKKLISHPNVYLKNKCFDSANINIFEKFLNLAEEKKSGKLLTNLIPLCLPPEVIKTSINPHFTKPLVMQYKEESFNHKILTTKQIDHKDQWVDVGCHDGTYSIAPDIGYEYNTWKERNTTYRSCFHQGNEKYIVQLFSPQNKEGISWKFAVLNTINPDRQNKEFFFFKNSIAVKKLTIEKLVTHSLFSHDNALLALCFKDNTHYDGIKIINIETDKQFTSGINGRVSALCTAHHSPLFVVGSDQPYATYRDNLFLFINSKNIQQLDGHYAPITHVEFSSDDTRLLTCSHDEEKDVSTLCLWDTHNLDTIVRVNTFEVVAQHKAIFICDGEKIKVTRKLDDAFCLLDGLTGDSIEKNNKLTSRHCWHTEDNISPHHDITIWSGKNKLIIRAFGRRILLYSSETGKCLTSSDHNGTITGIGLTADENTIIFIDEREDTYTLPLYKKNDYSNINFIEEQASIVQLYEMFNLPSRPFSSTIKSYIQMQQKK